MGFKKDDDNTGNNTADTKDWKADGFVNFYLPRQDGGKRKLGTIMLYKKHAAEADLLKILMNDPDALERMAKALIVEFNTAEPKEGTGFAF